MCVCLGSISAKDIWESLRIAKLMDCLQPDSAKCLQLPINYMRFFVKAAVRTSMPQNWPALAGF